MSLFDLLGDVRLSKGVVTGGMVHKRSDERATLSQIQTLLEAPGIDINAVNLAGESALHVASCGKYGPRTERVDVVRLLLQQGADVNAVDKAGISVLAGCEDIKVMELLIRHGVDVNALCRCRGRNVLEKYILHGPEPMYLKKNATFGGCRRRCKQYCQLQRLF